MSFLITCWLSFETSVFQRLGMACALGPRAGKLFELGHGLRGSTSGRQGPRREPSQHIHFLWAGIQGLNVPERHGSGGGVEGRSGRWQHMGSMVQ
jgi:hypothetical protein